MSDPTDLLWIELHVEAFGGESDDYVSMPRAEWDAMTEAEQEAWIQQSVDEHMTNHVSAGGSVIDADAVPAWARS